MKAVQMIHCIGAGSIGSFATQLLAILSRNLEFELALYDFDIVEPHNTTNQLYWKNDLGGGKKKPLKVVRLKKILRRFSNVAVSTCRKKVAEDTVLSEIVVVMVDSIASRKKIFQAVRYNASVHLFIDARSGGKHAIVYAFDPRIRDNVRQYEKTLEGTPAPPPCADARTLPVLNIIAGVIGYYVIQEEIPLRFSKTLINIDGPPIMDSSIT